MSPAARRTRSSGRRGRLRRSTGRCERRHRFPQAGRGSLRWRKGRASGQGSRTAFARTVRAWSPTISVKARASGGQVADAGGGQEGYFFWGQPGESEKKGLFGAVGAGFLGG